MSTVKTLYIMVCLLALASVSYADTDEINIDTVPSDRFGLFVVIVGDVPENKLGNNIRMVTIERILQGSNVTIGTKTPVLFNPARPVVGAGKYILLLTYNKDTLVWGYGNARIGQITNIYPVKTANDPEVMDVQVMLDVAAIGVPGLKLKRLQELAIRMSYRPLVLQYVMEAQVSIRNDIVLSTDAYLWYVLTHPENHPNSTLILADQLLCKTEMSIASTNKHTLWNTSETRRTLFAQLNKESSQNDSVRQYIENVIRSFSESKDTPAPTLQEK